jgi:hypothetical protein
MRRKQLRIRRWLVVASGLVTLGFASSASAIPLVDNDGGPTVAYQQPQTAVSRPPDVQDAATAVQPQADVLERYASVHPYGAGLTSALSSSDVVRPPDVRDAAYAARTTVPNQSSGFDWGDYGIGIGSGIGVVLLLAAGLGFGSQQRRRMQTA